MWNIGVETMQASPGALSNSATAPAMLAARAPCVTATAFGLPVVPPVKLIDSRSPGETAGSDPARAETAAARSRVSGPPASTTRANSAPAARASATCGARSRWTKRPRIPARPAISASSRPEARVGRLASTSPARAAAKKRSPYSRLLGSMAPMQEPGAKPAPASTAASLSASASSAAWDRVACSPRMAAEEGARRALARSTSPTTHGVAGFALTRGAADVPCGAISAL